ncbi:hypothetical protein HY993_01510 [Candidatus Micrarchaeota archaeon]|nr:hypothetical protein [Candidatus Micrarchaeota archaeon]
MVLISTQEGVGEKFVEEPFLPGKKIFLDFFTIRELKEKLRNRGFKIIKATKRPPRKNEFNYNKVFILARKMTKSR